MYDNAWILLDLFAVLLLLYTVNKCARRGFIRTLVNLLGYIIAAGLAGAFSAQLASLLYDGVVRDALRLFLTRQLENALSQGMDTAAASLLDVIPSALQRIMQETGRDLVDVAFNGDASVLAGLIVDQALEEPVISILRGICYFLIFSVVMLVVRRVSWIFGGIYKVPVLGTLNTALGGILGVVEGVVWLYIIGIGIQLTVYITGNELPFLNDRVLDSTYIYRVFFNLG